jgi:hypothetical protein
MGHELCMHSVLSLNSFCGRVVIVDTNMSYMWLPRDSRLTEDRMLIP